MKTHDEIFNEANNSFKESKEKMIIKEKRTKLYKDIAFILLIILLLILFDRRSLKANEEVIRPPDFETGSVNWSGKKHMDKESVTSDTLQIPGFKSMKVKANSNEVDVNLYNPEKNKAYMILRLVLTDTEELLYESNMIEPGKGLYSINLLSELQEGTYKAQIHYEPYDMNDYTRLNGAVMNFDLIAE